MPLESIARVLEDDVMAAEWARYVVSLMLNFEDTEIILYLPPTAVPQPDDV